MRFDTTQHPFDCGIDRHARPMDVGLLRQDGEVRLHRTMQARPDAVRKAIAPSRDARVIAVAGLLPWSGRADRCAPAGRPWVLGHALSLQALHGGKTTHDPLASPNSAVRLRGGRRPQASVSPAARRAPRARRPRRTPVRRTRAAWRAHLHHTTRQSPRPELGTQMADTATRDGVAARCPAPAGPQRRAVDRALLGHDDQRRRDVERSILTTATPPQAPTLSRRRTVPGRGESLRGELRAAIPASTRCPRGPAVLSSGRLVTGPKAAAGKRDGTSGTQRGTAHRPWACSEAAGRVRRAHPASHTSLTTREKQHGAGNALPLVGQHRGRTVSDRFQRHTAFALGTWLTGAGRGADAPHAALDPHGLRRRVGLCQAWGAASWHAEEPRGPCARLRWPVMGQPLRLLSRRERRLSWPCAAPPPRLRLTGARYPCSHPVAADGTRVQRGVEGVETTQSGLCTRGPHGASTARSVGGRHVGAPANGKDDRTCGQRRMPLSLTPSGKNEQHPLLGVVCLLTTGGLIRVRHGSREQHQTFPPILSAGAAEKLTSI
jgi:hypothetical protein